MNSSEQIAALIAAGEKAVKATLEFDGHQSIFDDRRGAGDATWLTAVIAPCDCVVQDEDRALGSFFAQAANAREAIRLAHEIAEAAYRANLADPCPCGRGDGCPNVRLKDLLAK